MKSYPRLELGVLYWTFQGHGQTSIFSLEIANSLEIAEIIVNALIEAWWHGIHLLDPTVTFVYLIDMCISCLDASSCLNQWYTVYQQTVLQEFFSSLLWPYSQPLHSSLPIWESVPPSWPWCKTRCLCPAKQFLSRLGQRLYLNYIILLLSWSYMKTVDPS